MEQLKQLNQFRIDAERNIQELNHIRSRHMNSIGRVESKINDYFAIIAAIRSEIILNIVNDYTSIEIEVLNTFNFKDEKIFMVKIDIVGFPSIYKSFSPLDYSFFNISRENILNDFVVQGRVKELAIEWLRKQEDWTGLFNQQFSKAEAVIARFVNDEAVFHFFKRRPIML